MFKELINKTNRGGIPTSNPFSIVNHNNHNKSKKIEILTKSQKAEEENMKRTVFKNREHFLEKKAIVENHSANNFCPSTHLDEDFNYVSLDENIYNKNVENIHSTLLKPKTNIKILDTSSYLPINVKEDEKSIRKEEKDFLKESKSKHNSSFSIFGSFLEKTKKAFLPKKNGPLYLCDCSRDDENVTCNRALNWLRKFEKEREWYKLERIYKDLQNEQTDEASVIQIEKDLSRTFPNHKGFEKDSDG